MSELEFQREKLYRVALSIAKSMLKNALISEEEYRQINTILLEKYKPKAHCQDRLQCVMMH